MSFPGDSPLHLASLDFLRPLSGIPTGVCALDQYLPWKGIPKGDLSLFVATDPHSAGRLWRHMMDQLLEQKRKVFWIQSFESSDLNFKTLKELIRNAFFEVLAISTAETHFPQEELLQLKEFAEVYRVSVVFICPPIEKAAYGHFGLVLDCDYDFYTIRKALHRATPFFIHSSLMSLPLLENPVGLDVASNPLTLWHQKRPEWLGQC